MIIAKTTTAIKIHIHVLFFASSPPVPVSSVPPPELELLNEELELLATDFSEIAK